MDDCGYCRSLVLFRGKTNFVCYDRSLVYRLGTPDVSDEVVGSCASSVKNSAIICRNWHGYLVWIKQLHILQLGRDLRAVSGTILGQCWTNHQPVSWWTQAYCNGGDDDYREEYHILLIVP